MAENFRDFPSNPLNARPFLPIIYRDGSTVAEMRIPEIQPEGGRPTETLWERTEKARLADIRTPGSTAESAQSIDQERSADDVHLSELVDTFAKQLDASEKIADLKSAFDSDLYQVDAVQLAKRMLQDQRR